MTEIRRDKGDGIAGFLIGLAFGAALIAVVIGLVFGFGGDGGNDELFCQQTTGGWVAAHSSVLMKYGIGQLQPDTYERALAQCTGDPAAVRTLISDILNAVSGVGTTTTAN